jgi:putative oxidoreductase
VARSLREDLALLILRLTAGLGLALAHGWGKIVALSSGQPRFVDSVASLGFPMPGLFAWAAALSEFGGGLAVALGLGTRVGAGFAAFTMAVAAFGRHHAHGHLLDRLGLVSVPPETLKAWGNPELALAYLAALVAIALLGSGRFAVERLIRR